MSEPSKQATDAANEIMWWFSRDMGSAYHYATIIDRHFAEIRRLQAENKRLRELMQTVQNSVNEYEGEPHDTTLYSPGDE